MSGRALGKPRDAGDRGGLEACAGKMQSKGLCWKSAERKTEKMQSKALRLQNVDQSLASRLLVSGVLAQPSSVSRSVAPK